MSQYQIQLTKAEQKVGPVSRWWLDFPLREQDVSLAQLKEGLLFQGWVLCPPEREIKLYLKQGDQLTLFALDRQRADVIEIILKAKPEQHPQLNCGFRAVIPMHCDKFELGVVLNQQQTPLVQGCIVGPLKVLQGKDDWLFLDNDTNKSVEQFTGKLKLGLTELTQWQNYFGALEGFAKQCGHAAMLLAPSKELVYPQYYPYPKAAETALDQLLALPLAQAFCINPTAALTESIKRTFRITDTHWSAYGACVAVQQLAKHFGVAEQQINQVFASDQYKTVKTTGDLGLKFFPPKVADEELLSGFNFRSALIYDNNLPNFGRVMLTVNDGALLSGHILIFGSSSSYPMLDYLVRLFAKVTLIHTAGNIDPQVASDLSPDYFLSQSNARFIVTAPSAKASLKTIISEKLEAAESGRNIITENSLQQLEKHSDERLAYFHQLLL